MISDTIALRIEELKTEKPEALPVSTEEWARLLDEYEKQYGRRFPKGGTMKIEGVKVYPVGKIGAYNGN